MRMSHLDQQQIDAAIAAARPRSWTLRMDFLRRATWRVLPALLPALLFLPVVLAPPLNQDVAAILQFSQRWLGGEHLYTDLIDVNPPLIFVLNLLPATIAAITRLSGVVALQLCMFAYGGFCWRLATRVRNRPAEGQVERAFLDVLPVLFLLTAGYDFGQREHLMVVAALPYLLAAERRAAGSRPRGRIAIGLLAGVAFALKPHFLGVPALVEAYVLLSRRPTDGAVLPGLRVAIHRSLRDPLPWLMAGVWAVYLVSLPLVSRHRRAPGLGLLSWRPDDLAIAGDASNRLNRGPAAGPVARRVPAPARRVEHGRRCAAAIARVGRRGGDSRAVRAA
jgi:hypothetical protein